MKKLIYITSASLIMLTACSKDTLDNINKNVNDAADVRAVDMLPSVIVESAFTVTGTELAWYASVYAEQNAGSIGLLRDADRRVAASSASLFDNNWSIIYENLLTLKDIINKCSPGGAEPDNKPILGIAQLLTAYNIAVATDVWGQVPWTQSLGGIKNLQPAYDKQEDIYKKVIFKYLNDAIANLSQPIPDDMAVLFAKNDLMYDGQQDLWIKAAWSLKARYFMHMQKVVPSAIDSALNCIPHGFINNDEALLFRKYEAKATGENPWYQFLYDQGQLVAGKTLYDLMEARNDPRAGQYFISFGGPITPAPNGEAELSYSGEIYSYSGFSEDPTAPTPLMTFHELKFIEAEALARNQSDYIDALEEAVRANFEYHGVDDASSYFTQEVISRLGITVDSRVQEILTQKYIAMYEAEALEVYNDYRRTRIPTLNNPNNALANYGFVERYPYPTSEATANSANMPKVNVFKNKVWWAGGTE